MNNINFIDIFNNPEKYISSNCIDICKKLWNLNIEAYEVNNNDNYIYIKLVNLSKINIKHFYKNNINDKRYYTSSKLDGQYLRVNKENINDLYSLIDIFEFQDSLEFVYDTLFLKEYNNGEITNSYKKSTSIIDILNNLELDNKL